MNKCPRANYSRVRISIRKEVQKTLPAGSSCTNATCHFKGKAMYRGRVDALGLGSQQTCLSLIAVLE